MMAGWLNFRRVLARHICPELAGTGRVPRLLPKPWADLPPADAESIGGRLRAERKRLGLSQTAFGGIGGVSKHSQCNYEGGKRHPDVRYLAAIAAAGADVRYIVTGERQDGVSPDIPRPAMVADARQTPGREEG